MRAVLVTFAIILAGCSSAPPEPVAEAPDALMATETTGLLRCVVVDEAINPIAGAMVIIAGQITHTADDGLCGADGLEPGPLDIHVSKRGHSTAMLTIVVEAGQADPEPIRIVLPVDPETMPYTQSFKHDAHIACSSTWLSACGHPALAGQTSDTSRVRMTLDDIPFRLAVEAIWTSTQPLGDDLLMVVGSGEPNANNAYEGRRGPSPLGVTYGPLDGYKMALDQQDLHVRLFASEALGTGRPCTPPTVYNYCANGVGVVIQQDVEVFVHAFHNWAPPQNWRFSVDGAPSPP